MNLGHSQLNLFSATKSMTLTEIEIYAKWKIDFEFNVFLYFASVLLSHIPFNDNNTSTSASTLLSAMNRSNDPCKRQFQIFYFGWRRMSFTSLASWCHIKTNLNSFVFFAGDNFFQYACGAWNKKVCGSFTAMQCCRAHWLLIFLSLLALSECYTGR